MATLTITILADAAKAKKALGETGDDLDALGKAGTSTGKMLAAGAAAGVAGLVALGVGAYQAAAESAKIARETERVIRTTGAAAWTSAGQVNELAGAISDKSGADDEAVQSGANLLLTFTNVRNEVGKGNDVFDQATSLALDMSTALGTDMSGASVQLGKALNDPIKGITALSKAGVSFTAQQKEQIRALVEAGDVLGAQRIVLAELQKEFGGAAEAAGTPLDKLMVKIGNFQESAGSLLIPAVDAIATALGNTMGPAFEGTTTWISENSEAVKFLASVALTGLAAAYGPVVAAQALMAGSKVIDFVTRLTSAVIYAGEAYLTVAAQQGVLTASTQALSYALAASGPLIALAAISGAVYGLISVFDKSSESADKFFDTVMRETDTSSLDQLHQASARMRGEIDATWASIHAQEGSVKDWAAAYADLVIPFHDVENSLNDQGDRVTTLQEKQKALQEQINATQTALFAYAEASVLAAHGIDDTRGSSLAMTEANKGLNTEIDATNLKLKEIAAAGKIDLTTPEAVARVQALYEKTLFTTTSTLGMSEAQEKYNEATATAKDKTDAFKLSLDSLIGAHLGAAQAETAYSSNSVSLLKTLTENRALANGQVDEGNAKTIQQTEAINTNNQAIQNNVKAALDLANAQYQETGSLEGASAALLTNRQRLIDTMVQTGYTREEAEKYIDRLGLTPANINTQVNLDNQDATHKIEQVGQGYVMVKEGAEGKITLDTKPAEDSLSSWERLVNRFMNSPAGGIVGKLTELTGRAGGGPVSPGRMYMVGERGPELFTTRRSGSIVPLQGAGRGIGAGGGTVDARTFNVTVSSTGLGPDSPRLQADVVEALQRWSARNGPLPRAG